MRLANKLYVFLPRDPLQEEESSKLQLGCSQPPLQGKK